MSSDALQDMLREESALADLLDDLHVSFVTIRPDGTCNFEKLGRQRSAPNRLEPEHVAVLAETIGTHAMTEGWSLRTYSGDAGASILLERRPTAVVDRVPDDVLQTLKKRARRDGLIAIAGPPGSGTSSVLLWAARHLADEPVLLVSESPPDELPGNNFTHVFPPETAAQHRDLQRLLRRATNVAWDRLSGRDDIDTLLGSNHGRRWVTLDSSDTIATIARFEAWRRLGYQANLDLLLQLTSSVIGRAEVLDLLVVENGEWEEAFASGGSRLEQVKALSRSRDFSLTSEGIAADAPTGERRVLSRAPEESPDAADALRSGIRKRPGQPTQDFDAPATISDVPHAAEIEPEMTARVDDPAEFLQEFDGFEDDDPTSSGEIDLQGFIARREAGSEDSGGMLPEDTRQIEVPNIDVPDDSEPDEIIPGVDLNAEETGTYNLENLKITRVEEVPEEEMDELRALRNRAIELMDDDAIEIEEVEEFDDLDEPSVELYFDAEDSTSRIEDPPTGDFELSEVSEGFSDADDDEIRLEDMPVFSDDDDEVTAEFSLGDKIRMIREKIKNDED